MLGKRPRPPMKRTTSMRVLSSDELAALQESAAAAPGGPSKRPTDQQRSITSNNKSGDGDGGDGGGETMFMNRGGGGGSSNGNVSGPIVLSPRGSSSRPRRNSADFFLMDATHFLRSCTLCGRHIAPGRDIYMYKGNTAYCSIECRQQQVTLDEKKEKCSLRSIKKEALPGASEASANGGGTTAAA